MFTFSQRQKTTLPTTSTKSMMPRAHFGQNREIGPVLHLQRTLGTQVVQRPLPTNAEEVNAASAITASTRFAYDFSQVPIHPNVRVKIQPKLRVAQPNDKYEQEADLVAEQVIRTPASQPSSPIDGSSSPENNGNPHSRTIQRAAGLGEYKTAGDVITPEVTSAIGNSIHSMQGGGQPLDIATKNLMSKTIGADFSAVRIHTDNEAIEKSNAINARAFTQNNHVFFNKNQYDPNGSKGRELLAHELTHTVQQGAAPSVDGGKSTLRISSNSSNVVQRDPVDFEPHLVQGSPTSYITESVAGLHFAANRARIHLNTYGIEVRNAISHFQTYANSRLDAIGEDIPGASFANSIISIALNAVPIPGLEALSPLAKSLADAIVSLIKSRLEDAAKEVTASRDTGDLRQAVLEIGSKTTDIATQIRDRAATNLDAILDEIILKLNNSEPLNPSEDEIVSLFYGAQIATTDEYLNSYFGIPVGDSLREVQLGIYRNLVRAFEIETYSVTRSLRQDVYYASMARGHESGVEVYARGMANAAVASRRREMELGE